MKRKRTTAHITSYLAPDSDEEATQSTLHHYREFELRPNHRVSARTSIITAGDVLEPPPISDPIPCDNPSHTEPSFIDAGDTYHEGIPTQENVGENSSHRERGSSVRLP